MIRKDNRKVYERMRWNWKCLRSLKFNKKYKSYKANLFG